MSSLLASVSRENCCRSALPYQWIFHRPQGAKKESRESKWFYFKVHRSLMQFCIEWYLNCTKLEPHLQLICVQVSLGKQERERIAGSNPNLLISANRSNSPRSQVKFGRKQSPEKTFSTLRRLHRKKPPLSFWNTESCWKGMGYFLLGHTAEGKSKCWSIKGRGQSGIYVLVCCKLPFVSIGQAWLLTPKSVVWPK